LWGYNVELMFNIRLNGKIRVISFVLSLSIFWQTSGWAEGGVFVRSTLQGRTLFTSSDKVDSSTSLVLRYVKECLIGIEDEPRNRNTARLKLVIRNKLRRLADTLKIPPDVKKIIPDILKTRAGLGTFEFDLGKCTFRYFNHNLKDVENERIKPDSERELVEEKKGQYLTKQIFIRDDYRASDDSKHPRRFGPALFVDPDTGELRELSDECDASGGITEHEAVNEAFKELVFDRGQKPFETGNPLYDFMQEGFSKKIAMYKVNREELKEKLAGKGYPRLAKGLITHAGTYRDEDTGETRAYNIFIPDSVYDLFTELVERKNEMKIAVNLLEFWRAHELWHLDDRDYLNTLDDVEYKNEVNYIIYTILALSRVMQALKKKEFEQALEYVDDIIEKDDTFALQFEIKGRIYEALKNQKETIVNYIIALSKINKENSKTMSEHPLEIKILNALARENNKTRFFKKIEKLRLFLEPNHNIFIALSDFFERKKEKNIVDGEFCKVERVAANAVLSFGVIPVMCGYLDRALNEKPKITSFEIEVVEKLLDMISETEILNSQKLNCLKVNDFTLARIYRLAGRVYGKTGDYAKALKWYEKLISRSENIPIDYSEKALIIMKKEPGAIGIKKAEELLEKAEEKFGVPDSFDEIKETIEKEKSAIEAAGKREKELKEIYHNAIALFESSKYQRCMDLLSEIARETVEMDFNKDLVALKKKAYSIIKLKQRVSDYFKGKSYEEAVEACLQILEKNPYDLKIIRFYGTLFDILENEERQKTRLTKLRMCLTNAKALRESADRQVSSGRIERARHNYAKAIGVLSEAPNSDEIQSFIEEIKEKLAKIKDLPDVVERHQPKPKKTAKKKKNRIPSSNRENEDAVEKNAAENGEVDVFRNRKLKIRLSEQAVCMLEKIERGYRNTILKDIHQVAEGKKKNVKKIETSKKCKRIKMGDYRVAYMIYEGETMLICDVESRSTIRYNKVGKQYDDPSTQTRILEKSVTIEEFEEKLFPKEKEEPLVSAVKAIYSKFGKSDSMKGRGKLRKCISLLALPSASDLREDIYSTISEEIGSGAEVLSVGVGTGAGEELFVNGGCDVTGIDFAPGPLLLAKRRGIKTINVDANKSDFWNGAENKAKFDAVFLFENIGYFKSNEIFKRIKQVLKPGGKIYILTSPGSEKKNIGYREFNRDDVIDKLKLNGFENVEEKMFSHWAGVVRLISAELVAENDNKKIVERSLKTVWNAEEFEANTKEIASCLVQGMIDAAEYVSEKNEKAILYIDEVLTKTGEKELTKAMKGFLRVLMHVEDNNSELSLFLKNKLEIRIGGKEEFIKKKGNVKAENIIVVTNKANFESGYFASINGSGIITAIDDTGFSKDAYIPLLGATLFALGKYLNWDESTLKKYYKKIPNAISIEDLSDEECANLFGKDSKSVIVNLIPDAVDFDSQEHVEMIERVRDILSKA